MKSSKAYFKPWIGIKYPKKRLLILGESHHGTNLYENTTIDCVKHYIADRWNSEEWGSPSYWTKIMRVISGSDEIERNVFWNSVAFYNYVQEPPSEFPRNCPTEEMWENAVEPFREVLKKLRPTHVLVFGKRLWYNLPDDGREGPSIMGSETWIYNDKSLAMPIKHPNGGLSYEVERPIIKRFLEINIHD